jgi:hypothetical protein
MPMPLGRRADMIEACCELDDQATEDFLNGKEIPTKPSRSCCAKQF